MTIVSTQTHRDCKFCRAHQIANSLFCLHSWEVLSAEVNRMDLDDHRLELFDCLVRVLVRRQTQVRYLSCFSELGVQDLYDTWACRASLVILVGQSRLLSVCAVTRNTFAWLEVSREGDICIFCCTRGNNDHRVTVVHIQRSTSLSVSTAEREISHRITHPPYG
jgi:hypothetical protein